MEIRGSLDTNAELDFKGRAHSRVQIHIWKLELQNRCSQ